MNLSSELIGQLKRLVRGSPVGATSIDLSGPDGVTVSIDLTSVDSLGCAFRELRLHVPSLVGAEFEVLKKWAGALSARIHYLLENIRPLELCEQTGSVLIRSAPPAQDQAGARYYEILLHCRAGGNFSLRRYAVRRDAPEAQREPVDIQLTHELLQRLVDDLLATVPEN